jgi:hypothetical protein
MCEKPKTATQINEAKTDCLINDKSMLDRLKQFGSEKELAKLNDLSPEAANFLVSQLIGNIEGYCLKQCSYPNRTPLSLAIEALGRVKAMLVTRVVREWEREQLNKL